MVTVDIVGRKAQAIVKRGLICEAGGEGRGEVQVAEISERVQPDRRTLKQPNWPDCPHHHQQRRELIGNARTWEDLDTPIWRKEEGEEEEWDAVEAFFAYLYRPLAGR
ncbi:hypothetical protein EV426DRAFT_703858 [Tirmania nivea]|nr:hypothetical protein EV426DRAFT_703858 [Tirmania nivea]